MCFPTLLPAGRGDFLQLGQGDPPAVRLQHTQLGVRPSVPPRPYGHAHGQLGQSGQCAHDITAAEPRAAPVWGAAHAARCVCVCQLVCLSLCLPTAVFLCVSVSLSLLWRCSVFLLYGDMLSGLPASNLHVLLAFPPSAPHHPAG